MIKIEAPDEHTARGGAWAVWRIKTGWVARWLRYEGKKK